MIDLGDVVALLRCCVVGARGRAGDLKSEREGRIKKLFLSLSIDHFTVL